MSSARPHRRETPASASSRPERASRRARTQPQPNTAGRPLPRRAYGSASTTESDPFSEFQPWASLFHSNIWSPDSKEPFATDSPDSPADVEDRDLIDEEHSRRPSWASAVLDPTALGLNFDHSCLQGLDHDLLVSPQEAFAGTCWDDGTLDDTLLDSPQDAFASICWQSATIAQNDINPNAHPLRQDRKPVDYSPPSHSFNVPQGPRLAIHPRPRDMAPVYGLDGSDDSDSDSVKTFEDEDDGYSTGTITTLDCYGALGYTGKNDLYGVDLKGSEGGPFELESGPRILVLGAEPESVYLPPPSRFNRDDSNSAGQFPTSSVQSRKLKVTGRIAAFCSTIPTKLVPR